MEDCCKHKGCNNPPAPQRKECYKCRSKRIRESDRVRFAYYMIRKSAKKRHLEFTLELPFFREFCKKHGYVENSGRLRDQMTIDRIRNWEGYTNDNIQVLQKGMNSSKYHHFDCMPEHEGPVPF